MSTVSPAPPVVSLQYSDGDIKITDGVYEKDGVKIELEGVCRANDDSIACWDLNGKDKPQLAAEVLGGLQHSDSNQPRTLQFYVGRKNRLLVRKQSGSANIGPHYNGAFTYGQYGWSDQMGQVMNSRSTDFAGNQVARDVYAGGFERGSKTGAYRFSFTIYDNNSRGANPPRKADSVDVEFKTGASLQFGGVTYRVGEIKQVESPGPMYNYNGGGPAKMRKFTSCVIWPDGGKSASVQLSCQAIGADGQPIGMIDADGKPVSASEYQKWMTENSRRFMSSTKTAVMTQKYFPALNTMISNIPPMNQCTLQLAIAPAFVKKIRVTFQPYFSLYFDNIPLDPK